MDAGTHRQFAKDHFTAYKRTGDSRHYSMHIKHGTMAEYLNRTSKQNVTRPARREGESQQLIKQSRDMLKAQLDTTKVDPQPWTLYSHVTEMKEGGKAMNPAAQKSLNLLDGMIKAVACKARLGSVQIDPEKGPVHEASKFPLQGQGGAYHLLDIGREAKEKAGGKKEPTMSSKKARPAGNWGTMRKEKSMKPFGKAGLFGGEAQSSTPASQVGAKLGQSPAQAAAPAAPGQESGGLKPGQSVSMQSMVPKKEMGAATPAGKEGAMKPGATVSMQKIASATKALRSGAGSYTQPTKRDDGPASAPDSPANMVRMLQLHPKPGDGPGGKSPLGKESNKALATPITLPVSRSVGKAAPLPARTAGEGRGPGGDPIYLQEMGAKPGATKVSEKKKEPKLYINADKAVKAMCDKCGKEECECVSKALRAASIPRLSRAMAAAVEQHRSATNVLTRANSRFAKDIHTGPLTGEVIQDLEEDAASRTRQVVPIYKSCGGCGRTYMAKGQDAECPTCSVTKSMMCHCGQRLVKGTANTSAQCPLCG